MKYIIGYRLPVMRSVDGPDAKTETRSKEKITGIKIICRYIAETARICVKTRNSVERRSLCQQTSPRGDVSNSGFPY
jgi:hypothetical protein